MFELGFVNELIVEGVARAVGAEIVEKEVRYCLRL
jgi:hypothetical protein